MPGAEFIVGNTNLSFKSKTYNALYRSYPEILKRRTLEYVCRSLPINFGVEVTNACNANCSFCGYRFQQRKTGVMDNVTFRKAIDDYSGIGGGSVSLTPTVGEPLNDRTLIEKIRYARSKKNITKIWFYTNLISLSHFNVRDLLLSGLSILRISTCIKDSEAFKNVFNVDKYKQVISNIVGICEENKKLNYPVKIKLYLRIPKPFEDTLKGKDYKLVSQHFNPKDIYILEDGYDSWGGRITEENLPFGNKIYKIDYDIEREPCYELFRRINVLYDGKVNFCVCRDLNADFEIGNIHQNSLSEIWKGEKLNYIRDRWFSGVIPEMCQGCQRYKPVSEFYNKMHKAVVERYIRNLLY